MKVYKFLDKAYVNQLLRGNFYFGSLGGYRELEEKSGNSQIGDKNEGVAISKVTANFINSTIPANDPRRQDLDSMGFHMVGDRSAVIIRNGTYSSRTNAFVFSTCLDYNAGVRAFCSAVSVSNYNSCVEIKDRAELYNLILTEGYVCRVNGKGTKIPLNKFAHFVGASSVKYQVNTTEYTVRGLLEPDPVAKLPKYSNQMEYRHFLRPNKEFAEVTNIVLRCRAASKLLSKKPIIFN